jgi:uncharacterized protein (DUF362 family)
VDFWEDEYVDVEVPKPLSLRSLRIAKTALDADLMLNMPVLKIHGGESQVTLCAKNMMGCISGSKSFMHQDFNAKIIDLLQVVRPDLNIVDGIVGMERDEIQGRAVGADLVVASKDFVACDSVCSQLMGFKPGEVKHVDRVAEWGFGRSDLSNIRVEGLDLGQVARPFERAIY